KVQPQLPGGVPLPTIAYWRFGLYSAYTWAWLVAGLAGRRSWRRRLAAAAAGALILTALDLAVDPVEVARGVWVWHRPGLYFGIPLQNFAGWFLTGFIMLGLFMCLDLEQPPERMTWIHHLPAFDMVPECICYLLLSIRYGVVASGLIACACYLPIAWFGWHAFQADMARGLARGKEST
ncbi:carotenoid biosynthesis protein, partial [bacterium]|nr:carotenoid biosynthesis protein [candidate division CSSED10-310 bacterium]